MIHHISIAAQNPLLVAQVIAEVWQGKAFPFFPHPGSYMVFPMNEYGTGIEVYPLDTKLSPGEGNESCQFAQETNSSGLTATHAAISVPTSQEEIELIGKREGWRVVRCNRESFFDVMEFWLENKVMLELLTPEMASQYLAMTQPENIEKVFAEHALADASA
ncbi:hypothetical protein HCG51_01550 [Tolypothrix sp. PCC 7910]|uniref:hypothetical protein n=1 Tax=Tolypothrix sp. PCC 7910 TaxID=2099387 RepID=UPI00142778D4|nr:hypothetical protein [Tolypothrix sp. PCC 7910]QIR35567.1 hypothetical protein HCG51_01550 [Tolypothrix sp. PCC 7910]